MLYEQLQSVVGLFEYRDLTVVLLQMPDFVTQNWDGSNWVDESRLRSEHFNDPISGARVRSHGYQEEWEVDAWVPQLELRVHYELVGSTSRPDSLWLLVPMDEPALTQMKAHGPSQEYMPIIEEAFDYDAAGNLSDVYHNAINFMSGNMELGPVSWTTLFWSDVSTGVEDRPSARRFTLESAFPNPFTGSTTIGFSLPAPNDVAIHVYDLVGRRVATLASGSFPAGAHTVRFDAGDLASGIYLVRMEGSGETAVRSVMLLK